MAERASNEASWLSNGKILQQYQLVEVAGFVVIVPAVIKMRGVYLPAKLAASTCTLYGASRRHAPYSGTLLVKPFERLIILVTLSRRMY